jgi:hypothetical protein
MHEAVEFQQKMKLFAADFGSLSLLKKPGFHGRKHAAEFRRNAVRKDIDDPAGFPAGGFGSIFHHFMEAETPPIVFDT